MKRENTSGYLPFNINPTELQLEVGLSSWRVSFEQACVNLRYSTHVSDEAWLILFANTLNRFLDFEHAYFPETNRYFITQLIEAGLLNCPMCKDLSDE